jgi:disulfide oxidoreductase YuzD
MKIKIGDLKKHEYNKEVFIDLEGEDFEKLVNSISQSGLLTPILIDENNTILCGHQRVRVYKILRIPEHISSIPILLTTKENDLVVDMFMGSGTTAVSCKKYNRNFIGFEISQEYVDIANKRLEQTKLKVMEVKQEAMQSEARHSSQA